jgi:hypothetical protein
MSVFDEQDSKIESLSQRRELSEAAKALLADKAFGHAYLHLRQRWFGQLMDLPHDSPVQAELAARLRALDAIPVEISLLLTDYREANRKANRNV